MATATRSEPCVCAVIDRGHGLLLMLPQHWKLRSRPRPRRRALARTPRARSDLLPAKAQHEARTITGRLPPTLPARSDRRAGSSNWVTSAAESRGNRGGDRRGAITVMREWRKARGWLYKELNASRGEARECHQDLACTCETVFHWRVRRGRVGPRNAFWPRDRPKRPPIRRAEQRSSSWPAEPGTGARSGRAARHAPQ